MVTLTLAPTFAGILQQLDDHHELILLTTTQNFVHCNQRRAAKIWRNGPERAHQRPKDLLQSISFSNAYIHPKYTKSYGSKSLCLPSIKQPIGRFRSWKLFVWKFHRLKGRYFHNQTPTHLTTTTFFLKRTIMRHKSSILEWIGQVEGAAIAPIPTFLRQIPNRFSGLSCGDEIVVASRVKKLRKTFDRSPFICIEKRSRAWWHRILPSWSSSGASKLWCHHLGGS